MNQWNLFVQLGILINIPYKREHISLSLNEDLSPMYSFGRLNPKTPIFAGFVEENINEGLYEIKQNALYLS